MSFVEEKKTPSLRMGSVGLGEVPRVVIAVRDNPDRAALDDAMAAGASIVEARIDEYASHDTAYVVEQLQQLAGLPVLATIRHRREGGRWEHPEAERLALYETILPLCDAVDAEIYSRDTFAPLAKHARAAGKLVIGSYHDFQAMPSTRKMSAVVNYGKARGAQVIKIAAMCRRRSDLQDLARFTLATRGETPVVAVGMGEHGAASRIFMPMLGSLLTYTFIGEATAPGQLTLDDTLQYLSVFCPAFRNASGAPTMS